MFRIFIVLLCLYWLEVNSQNLEVLSIKEQTEDIEYFIHELQKLHPGIYTYQSPAEFENGFDSLISSLKADQTVFEFYQNLVPVVNRIGCGHTQVKLPSKLLRKAQKNRRFLPLEVGIMNERLFVLDVLKENLSIQPGDEILSIDGVSSTDLIKQDIQLYASDGRIQSRKKQMMGRYFSKNYSLFHYSSEYFNVQIRHNGQLNVLEIAGLTYHNYLQKTTQPRLINLEFERMDSLSVAILTIRNSESKKKFTAFLESSFNTIRDHQIKNLIIDLRFDSFNRDSDGAELYSFLTDSRFKYYERLEATEFYDVPKFMRWITHYPIEKDGEDRYIWTVHPQLELQHPKPEPYLGNVFVLTDGYTFSATTEFSSIVKSNKRGLIISKETGGGYYGNNSGGMLVRKLPNSKLKVIIPPLKYSMAVEEFEEYTSGVTPDIKITETENTISLKDDLTIKATLEYIRINK